MSQQMPPDPFASLPDPDSDRDDAGGDLDWDAGLEDLVQQDRVRAKAGAVAVVLTPLAAAEDLAALISLRGVSAEVVETSSGALVWLSLPTSQRDEFEALLGDERPIPADADRLARQMSVIIGHGVVLLMSWLEDGDVEPGVSGQITARRYYRGEPDEALPAGLLLAGFDEVVEDLLLGRITPADVEEAKKARTTSRMAALRHLGRVFRSGRG